jgi:O-antigen ligase
VADLALGRPRGFAAGLLASVPFAVLAAVAAHGADVLGFPSAELNLEQLHDNGAELARILALTMAGAAVAMAVLVVAERRVGRTLGTLGGRWRIGIGIGAAVAVAIAAVAFGPDAVDKIRDDIQGGGDVAAQGPQQTRDRLLRNDLVDFGKQARADYWDVSLDAFAAQPLRGTGVGSFEVNWARDRPNGESVTEGHSVYLETLGELGLIGLILILVCLVTVMAAFAVGIRRISRPLYGVAFALGLAWLAHAAIDWDWELPALTLMVFALGGTALAAWSHGSRRRPAPAWPWRALAAAAALLALVTPVAVAMSQLRLDDSVTAFLDGDCARADDRAASASSLMPPRPEPYEIFAYCASIYGQDARALRLMNEALDRAPHSWELVYGLAWVQSAAGEDPRPTVARLRRMNPLEPLTAVAVTRTQGDQPAAWARLADTAPVPLP